MKVTTTRDMIRTVAKRWRDQYCISGDDIAAPNVRHLNPLGKYKKLLELDTETATERDVADIVGNDSWTKIECEECGVIVGAIVSVGQEPDYESHTANICLQCARVAVRMLGRALAGGDE